MSMRPRLQLVLPYLMGGLDPDRLSEPQFSHLQSRIELRFSLIHFGSTLFLIHSFKFILFF